MMIGTSRVLSGFRRRLLLRLLLAGALVSLLAGAAAYLIETERLDDSLVHQATLEGRTLTGLLKDGTDKAVTSARLRRFLQERTGVSPDYFVLAEIYDVKQQAAGEAVLPDHEFVEAWFDQANRDHAFPAAGETWYEKRVIRGEPYLQVVIPLVDGDGAAAGWFEGIYQLSRQTVEDIRASILQRIVMAAAAVVLTAMVLYPLMASLQKGMVEAAGDLLRANIDTLKVLGNAIAKRDSDTNAHNFRVTIYALRIAEATGMGRDDICSLIKGAFLHDVGKIAIPDGILLKPGKLDEQEFTIMKTHVGHGLDILAGNSWLQDAAAVVGGHHEKVDGSGYPARLAGEDIPLPARIFAIADVFDALTSQRPYKKALPVETAMKILEEGRGRHFDSRLLDIFAGIMPEVYGQLSTCSDARAEEIANEILECYFRFQV